MQEAFNLLTRARSLRQLESDNEQINGGLLHRRTRLSIHLSNGDGATLWVYLRTESRADAMWAAYALGRACSDCFEDFDLWDGMNHKQDAWAKLGV